MGPVWVMELHYDLRLMHMVEFHQASFQMLLLKEGKAFWPSQPAGSEYQKGEGPHVEGTSERGCMEQPHRLPFPGSLQERDKKPGEVGSQPWLF